MFHLDSLSASLLWRCWVSACECWDYRPRWGSRPWSSPLSSSPLSIEPSLSYCSLLIAVAEQMDSHTTAVIMGLLCILLPLLQGPNFTLGKKGFKAPVAGAAQFPGMLYSPACWRMWGPAHTRGPSDWHLALFLRPCFLLGGTWTSHIPSCSQKKGRQEELRLGRAPQGPSHSHSACQP